MAYHRIYKYTSIGRPLNPGQSAGKAVLFFTGLGLIIGAIQAWMNEGSLLQIAQQALSFSLIVYGAWALGRELDPDDPVAAYLSMAAAMIAMMVVDSPGLLVVFATLGLVRMVNRSTGLAARKSDSIIVMLLVLVVIYVSDSPLYGIVAGLAFILDGSLKEPLRQQWLYGLICFCGTIVYIVDHDIGFIQISAPESLFAWLSLLFLLTYALNTILLKSVQSKGDANDKPLDFGRVRGGMAIGLLSAVQGIYDPEQVVIIIGVISGICFGMAFRKGFKTPASVG